MAVLFDVTGSMYQIPEEVQKRLPDLFNDMLLNGYAVDPQLLIGAIGDANSDRVPLQVSQFESDVRIDENLRNVFLEGNGGGQMSETYELGLYFMARHTALDCVEKRDHRGYLFMIGDETAYRQVKASQVKSLIGDDLPGDIDLEDIVNEVVEKYELFFIIPEDASHGNDRTVISFWQDLLGDHALRVKQMDHISDVIAAAVGVGEGNVSLADAEAALVAAGKAEAGASVREALENVTFGAKRGATAVPSSSPTTRI